MNLHIYLEDNLGYKLTNYSKQFHRKRNSIVREAIKDWIDNHEGKAWSKLIMEFKGIKDFPDVRTLRQNLNESKKELF